MSPWMKNENSAGMTIPDEAANNLLPLWVFAIAWMGASVFVTAPMARDALKEDDPFKLLALAFPAAGLGLVLWAARWSWRIRKFGRSILHLERGFVPPGGELAGTIHIARPISGDRPTRLRLRCIQRTRYAHNRSRPREIVLHQQAQTLAGPPNDLGGTETDIPIRFRIPADAELSTHSDGRGDILWRLEVRRKSGLVSYFARFEVPVGVADSREPTLLPCPESAIHPGVGVDHGTQPREAGITCRRLEDGALHLRLAAARRKPIGLTLIGLVLTGVAGGFFLAPAPGLMRIITFAGGSLVLLPAAFLDYIAVWLWLVSQEVTVRGSSLVMRQGIGPCHWGRTFEARDIAEIKCKIDGGSSSGNGPALTYYGIQLQTRDGKSAWLASNITDGGYAAWLTGEIQDALAENEPQSCEPVEIRSEGM
jgi:hypothetical protein